MFNSLCYTKTTLILTIILSLIILSSISYVEAKPYRTDQELFDGSGMVLIGNIISKNTNFTPGYISYEIKIEKYLKNPQQDNVITAVGHNLTGGLLGNTIFEVGDTGMFYLNNYAQKYDNGGSWFISPYSYKINSSPLEQQTDQARNEIECIGGPNMCPEQRKIIQEREDYQRLILVSAIGIPALAIAIGSIVWYKSSVRKSKGINQS